MYAHFSLAALCIVLVWIYQADGEPKCSSFHYEEKLLEKMIMMEFAMEKMKTEMVSIQDNVKSTLAELNAERNEFMKELSEFSKTTEKRVNKTIDLADSKLQTKMEELNELQTSVEKKREDKVLFSVRVPKSTSLTTGQTMMYTTLLANDGDGYNMDTGIFTAPKAGLYLFNVQFCMNGGKYIDFAFVVGEKSFKASRIQRKEWHSCYDYNAFKFLNVGDDARIKILLCSSGTILFESSTNHWNTFSGTLIHK